MEKLDIVSEATEDQLQHWRMVRNIKNEEKLRH
jgi:hypothetical protein